MNVIFVKIGHEELKEKPLASGIVVKTVKTFDLQRDLRCHEQRTVWRLEQRTRVPKSPSWIAHEGPWRIPHSRLRVGFDCRIDYEDTYSFGRGVAPLPPCPLLDNLTRGLFWPPWAPYMGAKVAFLDCSPGPWRNHRSSLTSKCCYVFGVSRL